MSKSEKRPSWFKMFQHQKAVIDSVPDAVAGKTLKAALEYFSTGELPELDELGSVVFSVFKANIDEAFGDFQAASTKNKQNIQKRWANRDIPSDTTCTTGINSLPDVPSDTKNTEAEAEEEYNIYCSVVQLLNDLSGSSFRPSTEKTRRCINARINDGYTREDLELVIRHQCKEWCKDEKMRKYLRPETLFGNKFESYLSDARRNEPQQESGYVLAPIDDPWEVKRMEALRNG